jgi:lipoprotein LprG
VTSSHLREIVRHLAPVVVAVALVATLAACGGDEPSGPTLAPDVDTILGAAAETMGTVDTVRFTIERGGAPVYIDPLDALEFVSAEGRFAQPSSADAVVVLGVGDIRAQIGAIAIDGETWLTNPVTGTWEPAPAGYTFDPAILFDPELGWRPLLASELTDAELIGLEEHGDTELYHVRGQADEDRIAVITAGLVSQDVPLDLWLDPVDGAVREATFSTLYRGEESDWTLTFFDYGGDIVIEVPDLEGDG